jgi:hypothetical protein
VNRIVREQGVREPRFHFIPMFGERYPTNAYKQFLLCLLVLLNVSASRCHLQGFSFLIYKLLQVVCVSGRCGLLFVGCGHLLRKPKHVKELISTIKTAGAFVGYLSLD